MKQRNRAIKIKVYLLKGNNSFISYVNTKGFKKRYVTIYKEKMGKKYNSGIIYLFSKEAAEPPWKKHIKEMGKPKALRNLRFAKNQDERALAFFRVDVTDQDQIIRPKTFVLTFGGGHHLLKSEYIVKDFASKISRLFIKPSNVTSIDSVTIERDTFHTRRNSSKNLPPNKLLLRGELSLIKKFHGRSKLNTFIATNSDKNLILGGGSGLDITGNFNLRKDLMDLLVMLGESYFSNQQMEFNINELLHPVQNPDIKEKLNKQLEDKLEKIVLKSTPVDNRNIRGIDIQPPGFIPYENLNGIFITGLWYKDTRSNNDTEINVLDFFERLRILHKTRNKFNTGEEIIKKLKTCFIKLKFDEQENESEEKYKKEYSVYDSLVMEFKVLTSKYLLFNGQWFEVNYRFYSTLQEEINSLPSSTTISPSINYPKYKGGKEDEYNEKLSTTNNLLLFDQKFYHFDKSQVKNHSLNTMSKIEICDALRFNDTDIEFIHIKRKSGASGISHLVSQAVASATAFNEIQNEIINHINHYNSKSKLKWNNQNKHVTLVILFDKDTSSKTASSQLSILETLTIVQNVHTLRELGYQVYLKIVGN